MPKWLRDLIDSWTLSQNQWKVVERLRGDVIQLQTAVRLQNETLVHAVQQQDIFQHQLRDLGTQVSDLRIALAELKQDYISPYALAEMEKIRARVVEFAAQQQTKPPMPGSLH